MNFKSKPMKIVYYVAISIAIFISGYFYHKLQSLSRIPEIHISNVKLNDQNFQINNGNKPPSATMIQGDKGILTFDATYEIEGTNQGPLLPSDVTVKLHDWETEFEIKTSKLYRINSPNLTCDFEAPFPFPRVLKLKISAYQSTGFNSEIFVTKGPPPGVEVYKKKNCMGKSKWFKLASRGNPPMARHNIEVNINTALSDV